MSATTGTATGHGKGRRVDGLEANGVERREIGRLLLANTHELEQEVAIVTKERVSLNNPGPKGVVTHRNCPGFAFSLSSGLGLLIPSGYLIVLMSSMRRAVEREDCLLTLAALRSRGPGTGRFLPRSAGLEVGVVVSIRRDSLAFLASED
jgi:hypothetical protein